MMAAAKTGDRVHLSEFPLIDNALHVKSLPAKQSALDAASIAYMECSAVFSGVNREISVRLHPNQENASCEEPGLLMGRGLPVVFGLGQCSLDCIGSADCYPPPDTKCEVSGTVIQGGGPVATALTALSRWGLSCCMAGIVGDDGFGRAIRSSLEAEGVAISGIVTRSGSSSQIAFIVSEADGGRRTIFWQRPTGRPLDPEELNIALLRESTVFHTDGLLREAALWGCSEARKAGIPVVVDAGTLREGMLDICRLSDCFVASETFSQALTGDPLESCRVLAGLGPSFVGITLGEKGYIALVDGRIIKRPAYPARAIDTTGCGDVFHAGVIFGIAKKWNAEKSLDFGAWAAARVSEKLGGRSGIPTLQELQKRGY
jgi:ribokinase